MINPERYIGEVILIWNGMPLPTNFYMQHRNGRTSFVAETEIPAPQGKSPIGNGAGHGARKRKKIVSTADQLSELMRTHSRNMETFAGRPQQ